MVKDNKMEQNKVYKIIRNLVDFTISKEHRPVLREWLISDRDKEEKEQALQRIWSETSSEPNASLEESLEITWDKIRKSERQSARRLFIRKALRYAAIFILPLLSGLAVWLFSGREKAVPEMIECYVPNGEQRTVVLPDGSRIQVNAGTLLVYPSRFTASKRKVYLSGEANFLVESNPGQPFIVRTGKLNIEVLGTKFNVESYPGSGFIATTLEEGSVKVYKENAPSESIIMKPNEQVCYLADQDRFITSVVESADYNAWTNGELRFINKSLDNILSTLERKYNVRFLVDTSVTVTDLYTIKFRAHETIEDALYVLGEILGTVSFQREGHTIRLNIVRKEVPR